ncbi:hypothetical protein DXG01_006733 [Tephrocybe rancida]|nr:hypothetical protein DXG01_006733 [Tephrocybe rancida]
MPPLAPRFVDDYDYDDDDDLDSRIRRVDDSHRDGIAVRRLRGSPKKRLAWIRYLGEKNWSPEQIMEFMHARDYTVQHAIEDEEDHQDDAFLPPEAWFNLTRSPQKKERKREKKERLRREEERKKRDAKGRQEEEEEGAIERKKKHKRSNVEVVIERAANKKKPKSRLDDPNVIVINKAQPKALPKAKKHRKQDKKKDSSAAPVGRKQARLFDDDAVEDRRATHDDEQDFDEDEQEPPRRKTRGRSTLKTLKKGRNSERRHTHFGDSDSDFTDDEGSQMGVYNDDAYIESEEETLRAKVRDKKKKAKSLRASTPAPSKDDHAISSHTRSKTPLPPTRTISGSKRKRSDNEPKEEETPTRKKSTPVTRPHSSVKLDLTLYPLQGPNSASSKGKQHAETEAVAFLRSLKNKNKTSVRQAAGPAGVLNRH